MTEARGAVDPAAPRKPSPLAYVLPAFLAGSGARGPGIFVL